jgi:hypothetical protein
LDSRTLQNEKFYKRIDLILKFYFDIQCAGSRPLEETVQILELIPCFLLVSRVGKFLQALALASHWMENFAGGTQTASKTFK